MGDVNTSDVSPPRGICVVEPHPPKKKTTAFYCVLESNFIGAGPMLNQQFQQGDLLGTRNIHKLFPWFFQLEDFLNYNKKNG